MLLRVLLIVTLLAGCTQAAERAIEPEPADMELVLALRPFDDCAALGDRLRERALEVVGPYGLLTS